MRYRNHPRDCVAERAGEEFTVRSSRLEWTTEAGQLSWKRGQTVTNYTRWNDVRAAHVERAGGEDAVAAGKDELFAEVQGHRL